MKDSHTDEENSFFLQRSKQMYLLGGRIISFLSKETNEEMEIKDIHIRTYMQAARNSNRPVGLCCSQDGLTVGATTIGSKTGFPLKVNLLSNISCSCLGCRSKNKVMLIFIRRSFHCKCTITSKMFVIVMSRLML